MYIFKLILSEWIIQKLNLQEIKPSKIYPHKNFNFMWTMNQELMKFNFLIFQCFKIVKFFLEKHLLVTISLKYWYLLYSKNRKYHFSTWMPWKNQYQLWCSSIMCATFWWTRLNIFKVICLLSRCGWSNWRMIHHRFVVVRYLIGPMKWRRLQGSLAFL